MPKLARHLRTAVTNSWMPLRPSSAVFVVCELFLWSLVLQAPLRYGLIQLHLDALVYLPKLLMLAGVVMLPVIRHRTSGPAPILSGLILIYLLWGLMNLTSPAQALFEVWAILPFLFGLWAGPLVEIEQWRRLFMLLFLTTVVGVFINPLLSYPWSGQSMTLLGHNIEVSRQWTEFGVQRYAGFARASFDAAVQLLLFGLILMTLLRSTALKLFIWFIAGTGIALTTSKGPLGAWLILSIYFLGGRFLGWPRYWTQLWLGCLGVALLAMVLLPLSTQWVTYNPSLHGFLIKFLFDSFGDRLNATWPASLHLLDMHGAWHWLIGRGLGGIGAAQKYFASDNHQTADNLFVYVTVITGLPVSLGLFVALWRRAAGIIQHAALIDWRFPMLLALIAYGVVTNEIENKLLEFFLGVVVATPNRREDWSG